MKRVRLIIAYDGTDFRGYQKQPEVRTVEGELNKALSLLLHEEISVIGASRTDSGVHALGNVAVFDTDSSIPADRFMYAALPFLPEDLRIMGGAEVSPDWHPRKQDCVKTYEYSIYCGMTENPLLRRYTSYYRGRVDVVRMRMAAEKLIGKHDFRSFANPSSQRLMEGGSPVRTIYDIDISEQAFDATAGCLVTIAVSGDGFLYNMVRIIAGTLIHAGAGLMPPENIMGILEAHDRTKAGPTAEAKGLCLKEIRYVQKAT